MFFRRLFKIIDDNGNKKLELEEFRKGITEYGLNYSKDEMSTLFMAFDKDGSGSVDFDEFLEKLRVRI
jgi:Ca2+-binding EF-hand superfamily protein